MSSFNFFDVVIRGDGGGPKINTPRLDWLAGVEGQVPSKAYVTQKIAQKILHKRGVIRNKMRIGVT